MARKTRANTIRLPTVTTVATVVTAAANMATTTSTHCHGLFGSPARTTVTAMAVATTMMVRTKELSPTMSAFAEPSMKRQ